MMKILVLMLALSCACACSTEDADSRPDTVGKEIADDYNRAMQKAQDVEIDLQEQKQKMDEAIRDAERSGQDPRAM